MDYSKIPRQDGLDYDQNNPSGMEGQEDNQPGKTSVFMKKVTAKAKKIKNAMKKKDGNVDQDNNQNEDETVEGHEEEEVYYDDETVEDSQVHDSVPMNGSPAVTNTSAGQNPSDNFKKPTVQPKDEDIGKYGGSTGRSTATGVADVHVPEKRDSLFSPSAGTFGTPGSESAGNFVHGEGAGHTGQRPKISMETPTCMEEDPPAPKDRPQVSNYQSKVVNPTGAGGEEAGITGMLHSFNKLNVHDEPESKPKSEEASELYTGSQDQFSPEPIPPQSTINPNDTEDVPLDNATKLPSNQSGYAEKLSYGTTAIANQGIAAKNVIASKLGYGGNQDQTTASDTLNTRKQGGEAPDLYTESHKQFSPEPIPPQSTINPNDTEDVPLDNATKLPSNQNGYTEKLSYATSAIANQGIAAKNVVASKLGYGGNQDQTAASDTLSTRKQGGEGEEGENQKPVGIVTESEEVRERLGSDGDPNREMTETESKIAGNVSSPGKGMVESVKDTVNSWFSGGGDQKQASEASPGNTHGEEATTGYENGVGERRLQESGN